MANKIKIYGISFCFSVFLFGAVSAQRDSVKKLSFGIDTTLNLKIEVETAVYYSSANQFGNSHAHKAEFLFLSGDNLSKRLLWSGGKYNRKMLDGFIKDCPQAIADHEKAVDCFNKGKKAHRKMILSTIGTVFAGIGVSLGVASAFPDSFDTIFIGGFLASGVLSIFPAIHFLIKSGNYNTEGKSYLYSTVNTYNIQCH